MHDLNIREPHEKTTVGAKAKPELANDPRAAIEAELREIGQKIASLQQASSNYSLTFAPGSNSARQMFNSMSTGTLVGTLRGRQLELQARLKEFAKQ